MLLTIPSFGLDTLAQGPDACGSIGRGTSDNVERSVLRMGHPELRRVAEPVAESELGSARVATLVDDLWDTMAARGGIGLAATQIGEPSRVVVFALERSARYPRAPMVPRTVLVNPVIEALDDDIEEAWEGCLSVPGMRGLVPRHRRIRYRGLSPEGAAIDREVDGFHARVVQHECDHLDGVLYPMRMTDMSRFGFEEELAETLGGQDCPPD